jgi:hypothetical protein
VKRLVLFIVLVLVAVSGCTGGSTEDKARSQAQAAKADGPSLEKTNLEEKRKREEVADAVRYVYLMNYGQIVGYYVTKGKVSSSGSQATPTDAVYWTCRDSHGCQPVVADGPQDDGSYGQGDPGIFFFLADGTMVVTSLDYIQSDRVLPGVNAPKLGG